MNNRICENESISRFVLASSSPRRKELVASLDLSLPVSILSTNADETIEEHWSPGEAVEQLSLRKAMAAKERLAQSAEEWSSSLILAADTVVVLDNDILGKPGNADDALRMLALLQGREHAVYTGVALLHGGTGEYCLSHERTFVTMKNNGNDILERYVATGEPMDKAGAYGIQGLGATLVEGIRGCYFNVVGLPLSRLADMLVQFRIYVI
ncbi:Maf family protein [Paenibacillus sp. HB172176]|uniref:Maf family protein n=1 Tax=Paenibacillus sp. HB172176 TaxID=2493690 RepID=UPI00143932B3|nr:Maf family protein [Paenibacillus sp. HB172176]